MMKRVKIRWFSISLLFMSPLIWAQYRREKSFGDIAGTLFENAMVVSNLVQTICIIAGSCFVLASIMQYIKYRRNPTEVRLSMPIASLITGLTLIALSFVPFATVGS